MEIHYYGDIHSTSEHYDTTFQISSASSDLRLKGTERQSKQYHKSVHVWQNQSANITHTQGPCNETAASPYRQNI